MPLLVFAVAATAAADRSCAVVAAAGVKRIGRFAAAIAAAVSLLLAIWIKIPTRRVLLLLGAVSMQMMIRNFLSHC